MNITKEKLEEAVTNYITNPPVSFLKRRQQIMASISYLEGMNYILGQMPDTPEKQSNRLCVSGMIIAVSKEGIQDSLTELYGSPELANRVTDKLMDMLGPLRDE